jgi:hypothetical protein
VIARRENLPEMKDTIGTLAAGLITWLVCAASLIGLGWLLMGCSTPSDPAWLPKAGDTVLTRYCETCPNTTGDVHPVIVTKVVRYDNGAWRVMSDEFPNGIGLEWVERIVTK